MKRAIVILGMMLLLLGAMPATSMRAQVIHHATDPLPAEIDYKTGDTIAIIVIKEVYVFNRKQFRSQRHEAEFWRMVNDVKKTLPIAKHARRLLVHAYDTIQYMSQKEESKYFKNLEKELWGEYKPQLKRLNYRQGKLLVRLIDRECNKQSYQLIREFLGSRKAFFWQAFGSMFGVSLKSEWEPNGKDKELEDVCIQVEQGMI